MEIFFGKTPVATGGLMPDAAASPREFRERSRRASPAGLLENSPYLQ